MFFVVAAEEMLDVQHWASSIWLKAASICRVLEMSPSSLASQTWTDEIVFEGNGVTLGQLPDVLFLDLPGSEE